MKSIHTLQKRILNFVTMAILCISSATHSFAQDNTTIVKANDIIRVEVFNEPRVSTPQAVVSKSGEVGLPLLGQVNLLNLNLGEASEKVRALYEQDWLVAPKVTITILKQAEESISILGFVRSPGQLVIPPSGLDFSAALATAGGLSLEADASKIELNRADGSRSIHSYNEVNNGSAGKIKLKTGDRILVGQNPFVGKFVTIGGNVGKQGVVPFPLTGKLDLVSAIAFVGGLTNLANGKIVITRDGKTMEVDFNDIIEKGAEPPMLQPGDNIFAKIRRL
jgi:protein involved in polysaccharide export with SLBB domain